MKIKNLIIYFSVVVIVFFSLKAPNFLLNNLSKNIEKRFYEIEETKNPINVEAEKIYLVKAIHNIRSDSPVVTINSDNGKTLVQNSKNATYEISTESSENEFWTIKKELENMRNYSILTNLELDDSEQSRMEIISKSYLNKNKYIVHNVLVSVGNSEIHLEIEDKTGKIIYIYFDKDKLFDSNDEEVLRNFVKYLDLHIIDDWKYSEDLISQKSYLRSEKAQLAIALEKYDNKYEISVRLNNF